MSSEGRVFKLKSSTHGFVRGNVVPLSEIQRVQGEIGADCWTECAWHILRTGKYTPNAVRTAFGYTHEEWKPDFERMKIGFKTSLLLKMTNMNEDDMACLQDDKCDEDEYLPIGSSRWKSKINELFRLAHKSVHAKYDEIFGRCRTEENPLIQTIHTW